MPLPWVRLDTTFPSNPKLLAMITERDGHRAALVYICSLSYSGAHGTDGYIPAVALPQIHGRPKDAALLITHRFWHELPGCGWTINDWDEFQQSSTETQERARKAREGALKANCVRWHGEDCGCWKDSDP